MQMFLRYQEMHKGGLQGMMRAAITTTVFMRSSTLNNTLHSTLRSSVGAQIESGKHKQSMKVCAC
jgi:hypothetical protein